KGRFMPRQTINGAKVDPNIRCNRIYPVEASKHEIGELKTVGVKLNRQQAIHLATALLIAARGWDEIDITAYRFEKRVEDGTYRLTVTSNVAEPDHAP
ncbi:MAG TPA: hypothetical protein VFG12_08830, partial [Rhodopila sp.]|nr:hypothetical protein [Rhodopila sp.]